MKDEIKSLWKEERGASIVIGAMLMLLIMATLYGVTQAYHVPIWNKDIEFEHLNLVHDNMMTFKSDVENVALSGESKSSNIQMGMRYPNRMFLVNPGPGVAGSMTSEDVAVSIEYTIDGLGDPIISTAYTSNRIIYDVKGTVDSPKLVYEHGVIIRDYGSESATMDEQSLIIGDSIHIPVLIGSLTSRSSMETESIEIKPLFQSYSRTNIKSTTSTLPTDYPEVWEQLLAQDSSLEAVETSAGDITDTVIDTLEFDTSDGYYPDIVHVSGNIYAIAYRGIGWDGFVSTIEVDDSGAITDTVTDTLEFDPFNCDRPKVIHIFSDIYAIAYPGSGNDGFLKTIEIAADGAITDTVIDTLEWDTSNGQQPDIIHISGDIYAIAYNGPGGDGWLCTVEIDSVGNITNTVIDILEFDNNDCDQPEIIHISGGIYAIAYNGPGGDGWLCTVEIDSVGNITNTVIDILEFDNSDCDRPEIIHISGDIYAITYNGPDSDGWLCTVEIDSSGNITDTIIDSFEWDTGSGQQPNIIHISGDIYVIAYNGPGSDGWLCTVEITSSGDITDTVIDTMEFNANNSYYPVIIHITGDIYAIAYQGTDNDGFVVTVEIPSAGTIIYRGAKGTTIWVDLEQSAVIIESTTIKQIILPTGDVTTDALYAGMATFSTESKPITYTDIDISQDYPSILNITIEEGSDPQTESTITVTVRNATAPFDIHADFIGLTNDPEMYDVFPDYSSPDSISATSWDVPNENTVRWTDITHPAYDEGDAVIVSFWVINTENNMQFTTERVFLRSDADNWE